MSETFEAPQSRIEAILQNILGADNTILPPFSRNEVLLIQIAGLIAGKQDELVSGENIKTVNDESILGGGDMLLQKGWRLIHNETLNQDMTSSYYEVTKDNSGKPFVLSRARIYISHPVDTVSGTAYINIKSSYLNSYTHDYGLLQIKGTAHPYRNIVEIVTQDDYITYAIINTNNWEEQNKTNSPLVINYGAYQGVGAIHKQIEKIQITMQSSGVLKAGAKIVIWGIDK